MTATTTARESRRKDGDFVAYPVAASTKIPKGVLVNINAAGYAVNSSDTAGETFAGVSHETVDNSTGAAGDLFIRVETTGTFQFVDGGANGAQTDVGVDFKIVDNQTVTDAATTNNIKCGICVESISTTATRLRINRFAS